MRKLTPVLGLLCLVSTTSAQPPTIQHDPASCAVAERFPRIEATFAPVDRVAIARVVFQGDTNDWYSVLMKREGSRFAGTLPKPKSSLKSFRYYLEVTDRDVGTNRTPEQETSIVRSASECRGRLTATALGSASVVLEGPAGAAALPAGFASNGVVAAGSAAGSSTSSASGVGATGAGATGAVATGAVAAGAAAGGGIGATALIVGGVAVAGGAVAVASKGGDSSPSGNSGSGSSPPPSGTSYTGNFAGQRTVVFTYVGGNTSVGCQTVTSALSGTIVITLQGSSGTSSIRGTKGVVSSTGTNCLDMGNVISWDVPVGTSTGSLTFGSQNSSETIDFSGTLSGSVITGTLTFTQSLTVPGVLTQSGALSVPVTLR